MAVKLKIEKDELTIEGGENDLVAAMIAGCEGDLVIKTPFAAGGRVHIKKVKDKNGKVLKDKTKKDK